MRHPGDKARRQLTESRHSRVSDAAGSDHIVRWNTAKDISESQLETAPARPRAAPAAIDRGSLMSAGRKWSWAPRDEAGPWWPPESHDVTATRVRKTDKASADTAPESHLDPTVDRRLAQTRQMIEAKKEARRQRRNLKESGDYLGVQGINPETGQLDVITPTDSDRSSTSQETQQKLNILRNALKDARHSYKHARAQNETAAKKVLLESEKHKLRRLERDKQTLKTISQGVKWRRRTKQWSSAQEPELSPITQSRANSVPGSSEPPLPSCPLLYLRMVSSSRSQRRATVKAPRHGAGRVCYRWKPHRLGFSGTGVDATSHAGTRRKAPCRTRC